MFPTQPSIKSVVNTGTSVVPEAPVKGSSYWQLVSSHQA